MDRQVQMTVRNYLRAAFAFINLFILWVYERIASVHHVHEGVTSSSTSLKLTGEEKEWETAVSSKVIKDFLVIVLTFNTNLCNSIMNTEIGDCMPLMQLS